MALAMAAALVAGCTTAPRQIEAMRHVPTVTLPLPLSGVIDERQRFAALFESERAATGGPADGLWLHGVTAGSSDADARTLDERFRLRAAGTSVLIVPGLFDDCFDDQSVPFGDGRVRERRINAVEAYGQYRDLGLAGIRSIPLPGRMSSEANGRVVASAIRAEAARPEVKRIVVFGYSKGVPDTLHALDALQADGGLPPQLAALVSVAGVVIGTPYADQFERLFESLSPHVDPLACSPSDGREVASLTRRERVRWLIEHPLPAGLRYYSVVAHAPTAEIGPALRPFHVALSSVDPRNDGQLLATDAVLPRSVLLAEARADHWDVALPRDRHPNWFMRALTSGRSYPREALFRAMVKWAVADDPLPR